MIHHAFGQQTLQSVTPSRGAAAAGGLLRSLAPDQVRVITIGAEDDPASARS